ncbi:Transmembrane protein [Echinococcus granulosus]|uniref:Transmembrane protein n=1 Tax=Echinococcus granulosus TaxID=6210 RepID=W6UT26_ECHGR|nr:Transmembrane protein [Echinococcus granulosus]EUB63856.1 Transmembrane protein [Echinococcus granulosus]
MVRCSESGFLLFMEDMKQMAEKFESEFDAFVKRYEQYIELSEKIKADQNACKRDIKHYKMYIKMLRSKLSRLESSPNIHDQVELAVMKNSFEDKAHILRDMEDCLPKQNGLYLRIILGTVDVSFTSKQDKFEYKNNYENFKITVSAIISIYALFLYFFNQYSLLDSIIHLLIVWYYCTLTIRERILMQNGSRIKGWWAMYHFILTAEAAVMLIWPSSRSYSEFRDQFMLYVFYILIVQCMQYYYQVGCLYKLRALGERPSMDITVGGFAFSIHWSYILISSHEKPAAIIVLSCHGYMSWMSSRLSFVLVFLLSAYAFQIHNAYVLYRISRAPYCQEWQPAVVGLIYAFVATGNLLTTLMVVKQKLALLNPRKRGYLSKKYSTSFHLESKGVVPDSQKEK